MDNLTNLLRIATENTAALIALERKLDAHSARVNERLDIFEQRVAALEAADVQHGNQLAGIAQAQAAAEARLARIEEKLGITP